VAVGKIKCGEHGWWFIAFRESYLNFLLSGLAIMTTEIAVQRDGLYDGVEKAISLTFKRTSAFFVIRMFTHN